MCADNSIQILSQSEHGCIYLCKNCGVYNVVFKNIFLFLSEIEIYSLSNIFQKGIGVQELEKPIWQGRSVLVQTPFQNMYFCFDKQEYQEFSFLLSASSCAITQRKVLFNNISLN